MSAAVIKGDRGLVVETQVQTIVAALKRARLARGLTQRDVAAAVGLWQGTVSFIETGQQDPSLRVLLALADLYDMPLTLWEGIDDAAR